MKHLGKGVAVYPREIDTKTRHLPTQPSRILNSAKHTTYNGWDSLIESSPTQLLISQTYIYTFQSGRDASNCTTLVWLTILLQTPTELHPATSKHGS